MWTNWGLEILLYNRKGNNFDNESSTKVTVMKKEIRFALIVIFDISQLDGKLNSVLTIAI